MIQSALQSTASGWVVKNENGRETKVKRQREKHNKASGLLFITLIEKSSGGTHSTD